MNKQVKDELIRLLKWIKVNDYKWYIICDQVGTGQIETDMLVEILQELESQEFYQLILILITVYSENQYISQLIHELIIENFINNIREEKMVKLSEMIKVERNKKIN